ncbi:hypothetical protein LOTGIDRAFT_230884 [Lottia gigantea]|uniref:AAA+ ATPase domain-containing protein n=1 Tax=Lottia gigantea TaxID=225164 RepID=V4ART9_LOTGI|nr:hypothetical protein LOTGIDRAFT_230884 [Lottia gigantea]ESO99957.1 hypothetical protein LOTGIDRAFT_230884 [Lottia gigantea]
MPPKNKLKKQDWFECSKCHHVIPDRDLESHSEACQKSDEKCCFIFEETLNGVISLHSEKDVAVPRCNKDKIICIHPSAMQLCGLAIGKPCIVNDCMVLTAWPSKSGPVSAVTVSSQLLERLECKKGDIVSVKRLWSDCQEALEVHLSTNEWKEFFGQTEFCNFNKLKLEGEFLKTGSKIEIHYFGQICSFTVDKVTACLQKKQLTELVKNTSSQTDLSDSLASLDLSDISLDSESVMNQSASSLQSDADSCDSPMKTPKKKIDWSQFHTPVPRLHKPSKSEFLKISKGTKIIICNPNNQRKQNGQQKKLRLSDIGGLDKQIGSIKEMLELPLKQPDLLKSYGLSAPHGVLLFGPSGTGKTLLSQAIVNEIDINTIHVTGPQVWSKYFGETEAKLRNIFQKAKENSPSLIVIDELDALCPKRESSQSELEKRVVASLLTLIDSISSSEDNSYVIVIGITSKLDSIDTSLRRPGRFDREIEIGVPNAIDRLDIIKKMLCNVPHSLLAEDITNLANTTHGFVGADLSAVFKEAGMICIKEKKQQCKDMRINLHHIQKALTLVKPSAMREIQLEVPKVYWSDVGGQDDLKLKLKQAIEWPLQHPEAFLRLGVQPPRGLLMYGPPGCSKTLIAKALATESGLNFIAVKGPELFSKWVGESERAVREVFRKARSAAPSIIFFDEIDALAVERGSSGGSSNVADRVLAQLLTEIDGVENLKDVTIVAATNRPDMIDKALLRPGRIDRILYVPLPPPETRQAIFRIKFKTMPVSEDVNIQSLIDQTQYYSGAEVTAVCHEAALAALQEDITGKFITLKHFQQALKSVTPRTSQQSIQFYEDYHKQSGLHSI